MFYPPSWMRPYLNIEESNISATTESDKTLQKGDSVPKTTKEPAEPQTRPSQPHSPSANELIEYSKTIVAKYGLNGEKFHNTIMGESTFNSHAIEPTLGISVGISQFTLDTWLAFCSKIDERTNPYKALDCMGLMWSQGLEYHWDAYCARYYDEKCITLRGLYPTKL